MTVLVDLDSGLVGFYHCTGAHCKADVVDAELAHCVSSNQNDFHQSLLSVSEP